MNETCAECRRLIKDENAKRRYQFKSYCGLICLDKARSKVACKALDEWAAQQRSQGRGEWRTP
jgi:hypothetical protein